MTEIEKHVFKQMAIKNPVLNQLVERLGLDLEYTSDAQLHSRAVSSRVDILLQEFTTRIHSPASARSVLLEPSTEFFDPNRIERHLLAFYGPRPWHFPLATSPF